MLLHVYAASRLCGVTSIWRHVYAATRLFGVMSMRLHVYAAKRIYAETRLCGFTSTRFTSMLRKVYAV